MKNLLSCYTRSVLFATILPGLVSVSADGQELDAYPLVEKGSGKELVVKVISMGDGKIEFKYKNKSFKLPIERFVAGTGEEIEKLLLLQKEAGEQEFGAINSGVGHDLFGGGSLWNEKASDVAKRLKWPRESLKKGSSSYRFYPNAEYDFLGARPYCATLYGGEGEAPLRLSLVFANKGDYNSNVGSGADHFKKTKSKEKLPNTLGEAIELDAKLISEKLTEALGKDPVAQKYGEKEDKRTVQRWDFEDHSFLLSSLEGEYASLLIVPIENADMEGKVKFIKDSDLKEKQLENIVKNENGDVYIDNIPMVNQGPKGYCAPATFERAMSYMQVPADMYLLATAATAAGGGTNTYKLAEDCKRIIRSKARRIKDLNLEKDLNFRNVAKFIDKGVPILWQMRSLEEYNKVAVKRTKERTEIKDFAEWSREIQSEADSLSGRFKSNQNNHHICLIIGYNEATKELAVSDSWGPKYELRWVHIDIATAVTSRGGFVIDF